MITGEGEKIKLAEKENKDVEKAMEIVKEMSMSEKEWELYISRMRAISDYKTGVLMAEQEGEKKRRTKRC